jgi:hypothetical protein
VATDPTVPVDLEDARLAVQALCREVESYGDNLALDGPRWPALQAATRIALGVREAEGYTGPYVNDSPFNDTLAWLCASGLITARTGRERGETPPPIWIDFCPLEPEPGDGLIDLPALTVPHDAAASAWLSDDELREVAASLPDPATKRSTMPVGRYRTKRIELEAIQCTNDNRDEVDAFAGEALVYGDDQPRLMTPGGSYQYVHWGDWIAKDANGFRVLLTRDINEWFEEV